MQTIQNFDDAILLYIYEHLHTPFLDKLMIFFTTLGNSGFIWIALTFIFLLNKNTRKIGIMLTFSLFLELFLCDGLLKNLIQRPRPFTRFEDINMLIPPPRSYSFPSGHTASSFTAAFVIFHSLRKAGILTLILASLIAFSRIYLFCHYPTDVLAGIVLATIVASFTIYSCIFYRSKTQDK